ncbi:MAG: hypothetical protein K6L75_16065 [Cellvibrionaceae bacterium]
MLPLSTAQYPLYKSRNSLALSQNFMVSLIKSKLLSFLFVLCIGAVGCSKQEPGPISVEEANSEFQVDFILPADWEAFETLDNQFGGKDISVVTNLGTFITIYSYPQNNIPPFVSIEYFIKRYLIASIPEGEARDLVKIDSGEVDRRNLTGQFFHAKSPAPYEADFVVEVFEFSTEKKQFYIVLNNASSLLPKLNPTIDLFISTIE